MGRGFQRGRGLERGRGRNQAKYARKNTKYGRFQRARGRGISERDRGKNQAKYVRGKSDTSFMHNGITQHDRPLNCYTDLDMPVDEEENYLEDIRIGNPKLTHEVELEKRTEEQRHERSVNDDPIKDLEGNRVETPKLTHEEELERRTEKQQHVRSVNDGQTTELKGKRVNKHNQTHEKQSPRSTDYERDTYSSKLQAVNDFHGDLRLYIRQRKCMEFPDNEDRPMGSGHDTDDGKHEDVKSYQRYRSIEGRDEERPIGCFGIKSNGLYFDQDCLARVANDRHVDELNLPIDGDDSVQHYNNRVDGRKSNKSHLDERNSLHGKINTYSSNSPYGSRQSFKENIDLHQSHDRDFSIITHSNFGDHERNRMYGERKNNESPSTFYYDRKKSNERDEINSRLFQLGGKRGMSQGSNYDYKGGDNGRKDNTAREFKRERHEHIRVDEREHENLLHVRVDDKDMFLPRRSPLNSVKNYSLNGLQARNDAVKHERYISIWDSEKYEARRHFKEDSRTERRDDSRSFDNHYLPNQLSRYDQVRDPHVEHVTNMLTANKDERGFDNPRYDDRNQMPDAYFHCCDGLPRDHMIYLDNGFCDGNSNSRDLYNEMRDQLNVEELQRGQNGDPFDERVCLSNVQRKMHDEELVMHTKHRDFNADTELEGNRSTQSCIIDEISSGNHCPAELLLTQGGSHASRKRKRDFDSKIVKKTNRKRKSRSDIRKRMRTNENDRRSPPGNDGQRFITEEYMEKANTEILVPLGTEIVKAALNHPSPCASFDYLCNNTYQGREFETKYCLKTFVQKMFEDTGIKITEDGIEIPKVKIKICQTYTKFIRHDHVCKDIHICKFFMIGRCNKGDRCPRLHNLRHTRNNLVLKRKNIDKLPDSIVLELCRHIDNRNWTTLPIVCKFYNNEACKHGDRCHHLHICKFYIADDCKFGEACKRNHRFQSLQTRNVLENFGIENIQEEEIKIIMQMAVKKRRAYEKKNGSNSPIETFLDAHF
ncbi:uncharacterized protein LOC127836177 [Dreissena polymorpha]|uniref:C3H1-type domain-containing protein n=1 Tax=Dreissena polymorpha TaxID=45954 RepID=A0A9D4FS00_DREPO|nr:uncharacterized protein LOC127834782 [Dreissena polymorpha]XP_052218618.1 uncharacterized protein LOC127836177 [Dreissena polymorpha]KAH3803918.1 hypothetical protein DPMN_132190 [Dreissena polymorpha]KAH3811066.1 hypothetical protein DPMN_139469 [Dreissena polymorpha]